MSNITRSIANEPAHDELLDSKLVLNYEPRQLDLGVDWRFDELVIGSNSVDPEFIDSVVILYIPTTSGPLYRQQLR